MSRLSKSCPFNDARISYRRSKARGRSSKEDPKINQVYLFRWQSRESINLCMIKDLRKGGYGDPWVQSIGLTLFYFSEMVRCLHSSANIFIQVVQCSHSSANVFFSHFWLLKHKVLFDKHISSCLLLNWVYVCHKTIFIFRLYLQ